jgi:hypothetical protein
MEAFEMRYFDSRNTLYAVALAIVCLPAAGCYTQLQTDVVKVEPVREPPPGHVRTDDLSFTTDRPWYESSQTDGHVIVGAVFENNGYVPVPLSGCPHPPSVVIEEWDGEEWKDGRSIGIFCLAIHSVQVVDIDPGESFSFEVKIEYPGWYRLRLLLGPNPRRPTAVVHSSQFLVR